MAKTVVNPNNIDMDADGRITASSKGIITLLPLVAATTFGVNTNMLTLNNYFGNSDDTAYVYSEDQYLSKIELSEGIELSESNTELTGQPSQNFEQSTQKEFEVLENFVGKILEHSEQQPGELKSLMYDNIDELLI